MKKIIITIIIAILIAGFSGIVDNYIDFDDYSLAVGINNTLFSPLTNPGSTPEINNSTLQVDFNKSSDGQNLSEQNNSYQDLRTDTIIKFIYPAVIKMEYGDKFYLLEDIYHEKFDSRSNKFEEPGLVFTFQVLDMTNICNPKPVSNSEVALNINGSYSVFNNYSVNYTDSQGYVSFIFNRPLTDTEWGYRLPSTQPVELEIIAEFLGNEYYKPSKTMPIYTRHWPKDNIICDPPVDGNPINICLGGIIIIIFISSVLFYIEWQR